MKSEKHREETEYKRWCKEHETLAEDCAPVLRKGFMSDIELDPQRWFVLGLDLINSRKGVGAVQLMGGIQGRDIQAYLPYPVFQVGAEVFLKGMWLCQFIDLRQLSANSYVEPKTRDDRFKDLKKLSHDIPRIIASVSNIDEYRKDEAIMRFLGIVLRVSRYYYSPLRDGKNAWAHARYPRRFYDDSGKVGAAEGNKSYPLHQPLARLFEENYYRINLLWDLTRSKRRVGK